MCFRKLAHADQPLELHTLLIPGAMKGTDGVSVSSAEFLWRPGMLYRGLMHSGI